VLTVADAIRWVGLDVHASQTTVAVLDRDSGELTRARLRGSPEQVVVEFLSGFDGRVIATYEAGPTGMKLARVARERGIEMRVCAPGLIPRKPTDRIKTDARDAERLVRQLAAGGLSFVRVPTEEEEALRDLVRAREDVRQDLSRARHRLSKMLLRRGLRYEAGKAWSERHIDWVVRLKFDDLASRIVVGEYVNAVQQLDQRRKDLEATIEELLPSAPFAQTAYRLRCFRGLATLSAVGLCCEVGDFTRFTKPAQLAAFLGIVPAEYTTDSKRRLGSITKAGSSHARRLLVEAAYHYRRRPNIGKTLEHRQRGQQPAIVDLAWRTQRRLHARWRHLHGTRGKPNGVVAIAVARELAASCWRLATQRP
jgi:transposase